MLTPLLEKTQKYTVRPRSKKDPPGGRGGGWTPQEGLWVDALGDHFTPTGAGRRGVSGGSRREGVAGGNVAILNRRTAV